MNKPKLSIIISINFSIRYLLRSSLIEKLLYNYDIKIYITWRDPDLIKELENIGCNVVVIPKAHFNYNLVRSRKLLKLWHEKKF